VRLSDADEQDPRERQVAIDMAEDDGSPLLAHIAVAQVAAIERDDPWDQEVFQVRRSP
jgi:hypothetical protein